MIQAVPGYRRAQLSVIRFYSACLSTKINFCLSAPIIGYWRQYVPNRGANLRLSAPKIVIGDFPFSSRRWNGTSADNWGLPVYE